MEGHHLLNLFSPPQSENTERATQEEQEEVMEYTQEEQTRQDSTEITDPNSTTENSNSVQEDHPLLSLFTPPQERKNHATSTSIPFPIEQDITDTTETEEHPLLSLFSPLRRSEGDIKSISQNDEIQYVEVDELPNKEERKLEQSEDEDEFPINVLSPPRDIDQGSLSASAEVIKPPVPLQLGVSLPQDSSETEHPLLSLFTPPQSRRKRIRQVPKQDTTPKATSSEGFHPLLELFTPQREDSVSNDNNITPQQQVNPSFGSSVDEHPLISMFTPPHLEIETSNTQDEDSQHSLLKIFQPPSIEELQKEKSEEINIDPFEEIKLEPPETVLKYDPITGAPIHPTDDIEDPSASDSLLPQLQIPKPEQESYVYSNSVIGSFKTFQAPKSKNIL